MSKRTDVALEGIRMELHISKAVYMQTRNTAYRLVEDNERDRNDCGFSFRLARAWPFL